MSSGVLANVGVPMLAVQFPAMLLALLPIIVIEGMVARRKLGLPAGRAYGMVAVDNAASTVVGIPLAWAAMLLIGILATGRGGAAGLGTPVGVFFSVVLQAAWLVPYESELHWMIPAASVVLLVPSFFVSVWMESLILARAWKELDRRIVRRTTWAMNILSYVGLFTVGATWLGTELRKIPIATISVAEETLHQAKGEGFAYQRTLARAEAGSQRAMGALFRFTGHTDAAGGLGHGVVLLELLDKVGDRQFAEALQWQSDETRASVALALKAGVAYTTIDHLKRPIAEGFPLTSEALQQRGD